MFQDDYIKVNKRGLVGWLVVGLLVGLSFFPARWCYQRLKAAEQIFVYFNGELAGPDGKGVGFNRATVLEQSVLQAIQAATPPKPATTAPAPPQATK